MVEVMCMSDQLAFVMWNIVLVINFAVRLNLGTMKMSCYKENKITCIVSKVQNTVTLQINTWATEISKHPSSYFTWISESYLCVLKNYLVIIANKLGI